MVPKVSPEDTVITATNAAGERKTIPVPKGTYVVLDTPAVHHNRRWSLSLNEAHIIEESRLVTGKTLTISSPKGSWEIGLGMLL